MAEKKLQRRLTNKCEQLASNFCHFEGCRLLDEHFEDTVIE